MERGKLEKSEKEDNMKDVTMKEALEIAKDSEEMKKISIEELEKVTGGGDYDFIHYNDGKSCRHSPAMVLESEIKETRTVGKFICRRCGEVAYYWRYPDEGDMYFVTEEEYNVIKANRR